MSINLRSKLLDGLLTPLIMVLFSVMFGLIIRPVDILFQRPGLLVYTFILLALAVLALERCLVARYPDYIRAWLGMMSGLLTWYVIEMSNLIGLKGVANETGMLSLMLVGLVVSVLWRRVLPLGVKFFSIAVLGGWFGHMGLNYASLLVSINPGQSITQYYPVIEASLAGICVLLLAWMFLQAKTRLARLWGSLGVWICIMLLIYIFNGTMF